jgi:serine/threonine protein kinase
VVEHSPSVHTADLIEHGPRSRMHADLSEVTDNATALNDALPISEVHASRDGLLTQHFESDISEFEPKSIFVTHRFLGHGSLGIVEEVQRSNMQLPTFVGKRVQLPAHKREAKATLDIIQEESRILRALVHPHIVSLIVSYEEKKHSNAHFYFLLMSPVGETDLKRFPDVVGDEESSNQDAIQWKKWIRKWFTYVASALTYIHGQ